MPLNVAYVTCPFVFWGIVSDQYHLEQRSHLKAFMIMFDTINHLFLLSTHVCIHDPRRPACVPWTCECKN